MSSVLDDRKAAILRAIVREFVRDGEPVGSKRLAERFDLGVSAATVRSDMAALEDAGLISQPHTSAGRVPTDLGYRYFVDSLDGTVPLGADQQAAVEGLLLCSADVEELLRRASGVLSRLTHFAALVAAPRFDRSRLRHVELVQLSPMLVLAVLIADTGRVEKRVLELREPLGEHDVGRARHALNEVATGLRLDQARHVVAGLANGAPAELRTVIEAVATAIDEDLAVPNVGGHVYVGGTANIAGAGYFERLEQVQQVYEMLEEQVVLLQTLQHALDDEDPAVRIGAELPVAELAACSVVASRYEADGEAAGSVGVLGPTRMDYPQTLAAVQAVASSLERALSALDG
ncbi:MAG: heat-inducible transcriptional repressor HrcA [Egibacteraceae bacterium]